MTSSDNPTLVCLVFIGLKFSWCCKQIILRDWFFFQEKNPPREGSELIPNQPLKALYSNTLPHTLYQLGFLYSLDSWALVFLYSWVLVFLYQVRAFKPYPKWRWRGRPVASRAGCGGCRASTPVSGLKPRDGAFPFPNAEGDLYAHLRERPYGLWRALGRTWAGSVSGGWLPWLGLASLKTEGELRHSYVSGLNDG